MKFKLLSLIVVIPLLCACSSDGVKPKLDGISFEADISYYNEKYICDVQIASDGIIDMQVLSPDSLKGLKLTFSNGSVTAEYMGLKYTPNTGLMPIGNAAVAIHDIINDVRNNEEIVLRSNENSVIEGRCNNTAYKFQFSPSGLPLSLEIPDNSFKIEFNNLTVL